jgi:hypothetical protein
VKLYRNHRTAGENCDAFDVATESDVLTAASEILRKRAGAVFQQGRSALDTVLSTCADVCEREAKAPSAR